eukprot:CAMPEP_0194486112 /NCGR_PEP_ID=MMETSP0253-20130528/6885_1 /TAXON_ID=2966 /ORGANISM="Noctiluca scintillans" /LENGTH=241 /DNA_ID=CAMNT_0039326169 /DNA_START=53 /DNA_END=778 /DNA_ORIENTATION=-
MTWFGCCSNVPRRRHSGSVEASVIEDTSSSALTTKFRSSEVRQQMSLTSLRDEVTLKLHSSVRWGKGFEEFLSLVREEGVDERKAIAATDARTGNQCLHIAAQNGHRDLVRCFLRQGADVNCQNKKGHSPLHMSVQFDFYFISKNLLENKADPWLRNELGFEALSGLEGEKRADSAWDAPLSILNDAEDDFAELSLAFVALEQMPPHSLDKATLAKVGMRKRKECKHHWNQERFVAIISNL